MVAGHGLHLAPVVRRIVGLLSPPGDGGVGPPGEDVGETLHHALVIGRHRLARGIGDHRSVEVELHQTDGEELQQLPGIVLVGRVAHGRIGLVVVRVTSSRICRKLAKASFSRNCS